jgi:hypothetical protein
MNGTAAKSEARTPSVYPDRRARQPIFTQDAPSESFGFVIVYETPINLLRVILSNNPSWRAK